MKTAILGAGCVGGGLLHILDESGVAQAVRIVEREGSPCTDSRVTHDISEVLRDGGIEAVAEAIGGVGAAYDYVLAALKCGKHVVTANKQLVAERGAELHAAAQKSGAALLFSAACGGGIPFLRELTAAARYDDVLSLGGILNGTANYILDLMQRGSSFEHALAEAQALGYAEADPSADIDGHDTSRKCALGCAVAFGELPAQSSILMEGIRYITAEDVRELSSRGLCCRLTAYAERREGSIFACVQPELFSLDSAQAAVRQNYNRAWYYLRYGGLFALTGQGAGALPTGGAMARDLCDIMAGERTMLARGCRDVEADGDKEYKYYIRVSGEGVEYTARMSAREMHRRVKELRGQGKEVFFAALDE